MHNAAYHRCYSPPSPHQKQTVFLCPILLLMIPDLSFDVFGIISAMRIVDSIDDCIYNYSEETLPGQSRTSLSPDEGLALIPRSRVGEGIDEFQKRWQASLFDRAFT